MTFQGDPYRVLGVAPGASANEVRSAYRRLVKQWHPDAAGDRALPRFLAIQAAYERLVDGDGRLRPAPRAGSNGAGTGAAAGRGAAHGGAPGSSGAGSGARHRASRDAWRARRTSWSPGTGTGGWSGTGTGTGAGRPAGQGGGGAAGGATGGGASGSGAGAGAGSASGSGAGSASGARHRERRAHHRARTARPGSTTYDEALDPIDPSWSGATWYGATSGTYWTINPREYADPRKHGREYLARARRGEPPSETAGDPHDWGARAWTFTGTPVDGSPMDDPTPASSPRPEPRSAQRSVGGPDLEAWIRRITPATLRELAGRPDRRWRLLLAWIAWPPVGFAVASLIDILTGCAVLATSCSEPARWLPVAVQPLLVLGLAVVPVLAAQAAFASLAALAVALPAATVIAVWARFAPDLAQVVLGSIAIAAWLAAFGVPLLAGRAGGRRDGEADAERGGASGR